MPTSINTLNPDMEDRPDPTETPDSDTQEVANTKLQAHIQNTSRYQTPETQEPPEPQETTSSLADLYEDYESENARTSKGGGGKKQKPQHHGRKTNQAIATSNTESAEKNRKELAKQNLKKDLEHFPTSNSELEQNTAITNYLKWLSKNLSSKTPIDIEQEIRSGTLEQDTKRRSSGPGGQNVNKTAVTAVCYHNVTGMTVESTKTRELPKNQRHALSLIISKLQRHMDNWRVLLQSSNQDIAELAYTLLEDRI